MKKTYAILAIVVIAIIVLVSWSVGDNNKNPFGDYSVQKVENWDFKGAYEGNVDLESKANSEVERLTGLIGSGEYTDYELYVSIANQYNLLGDGEKEYKYLGKALSIDSDQSGLAWHNVGALMERLGYYDNARIAYEKAFEVQQIPFFQSARDDFINRYFPEDSTQ